MILQRVKQTDFATYGELLRPDGAIECCTIELPWRDNAPDVSCIPAGRYTAARYFSPHHQCVVFALAGVPGRANVELHVANLPSDLNGCIGLGKRFGFVTTSDGRSGDGVLGSRTAFQAFMANHPEQSFTLTVVDIATAFPEPADAA